MTPTSPDIGLGDARRDLAALLLSLGGATLLTGLVLASAPLFARLGSSARGPDLLVRVGVVIGGSSLLAYAVRLAVRARRGWRGSPLPAAALGAVGLGSLSGFFSLAALLPGDSDRPGFAVPGLISVGASLVGIGWGLLRSHRWVRAALASLAALVSAALLWGATASLLSYGDVGISVLALAAAAPAALLLASLCLPGGAALICRSGTPGEPPDVPPDPERLFFVAGSRLSIGLFVLLWLSVVVLVAPNLANAIHRSRQRRTLGELRTVMTAVEAYAVDNNAYPDATTIDALARALEPVYLTHMPRRDGWGWPLDYRSRSPSTDAGTGPAGGPPAAASHGYVVRSPGRDGVLEHPDPFAIKGGPTTGFDRDIVYGSNSPSQWPEGTMRP